MSEDAKRMAVTLPLPLIRRIKLESVRLDKPIQEVVTAALDAAMPRRIEVTVDK